MCLGGSCTQEPAPSGLANRATPANEKPKPVESAPASANSSQAPAAKDPASAAPKVSADEVLLLENPDGPKTRLLLGLEEGSIYRMTTVGALRLPLVQQPTGFAREEQLTVSACTGEGEARSCTLEHRYRNFDAEPPAGAYLKRDEQAVAALVTRHSLRADGTRAGATTVEGPAPALESENARELADVERFYCIRLPREPVAVGARWAASCRQRAGGLIDTRELIFKLENLDKEPGTNEARAEISYMGTYAATAKDGPRTGAVTGRLYLWATAGAPHLLTEQLDVLTGDKESSAGMKSVTTIKVQFTRVLPGPPEELVRTDGRPFSAPPQVLNSADGGAVAESYRVAAPPTTKSDDGGATQTKSDG